MNSRISQPLIIDIETVPIAARIKAMEEPTAPTNYKDPDKIATYIENKKSEQIQKMALDIDHCRVVALGWASGFNEEPSAMTAMYHSRERVLIKHAWKLIDAHPNVIGYNIIGFDLPILLRRAWVLNIELPFIPYIIRNSHEYIDLMQLLYHNGYGPGPRARGLKAVCEMYRIENPMPEVDGSMVGEMSEEVLLGYVASDILITQQLARRMKGYYF